MAASYKKDCIINWIINGVRGNKVYNDAESKDVEKYVVYSYANGEDDCQYAYKDPECTQKIDHEELRDMFMKGAIIMQSAHDNSKKLLLMYAPSVYEECNENGIVFSLIAFGDGGVVTSKEAPILNN